MARSKKGKSATRLSPAALKALKKKLAMVLPSLVKMSKDLDASVLLEGGEYHIYWLLLDVNFNDSLCFGNVFRVKVAGFSTKGRSVGNFELQFRVYCIAF